MDEYRSQKVLITGGLGFIGSSLAVRLAQLGASVTILDSLHPTCGGNFFNIDPVKKDVEFVQGESCNLELVRKLVRGKVWYSTSRATSVTSSLCRNLSKTCT